MHKKFSALIILLIAILTLTGCAKGGYSINIYADGRMMESFYVELNKNTIELAGYNYEEVVNEVLSKFQEVRTNLMTNFTLANNGLTILQKNKIKEGIRMPAVENNVIGVSFLFDSYNHYKLFYGVNDSEETPDNKLVENKTFFTKTTTTTKTVFNDADNSTLASSLLSYFSDQNNGNLAFTLSDISFTYRYATSSQKLYSNADRTYKTTTGLKVYEWDVPSDNYAMEIEFYEYQIITTWWYVLAVLLTLVFVGGMFVYHIILEKKKEKESKNVVTIELNTSNEA